MQLKSSLFFLCLANWTQFCVIKTSNPSLNAGIMAHDSVLCFLMKFASSAQICYSSNLDYEFSSIQRMMIYTTYCCSLAVSSLPLGMPCHFSRQPRQQVAVACWARNTGWPFGAPRIGVCSPSFAGSAGASRFLTISAACSRMVSIPFSEIYRRSASDS